MLDYLAREEKNPNSTDIRVTRNKPNVKRKRSSTTSQKSSKSPEHTDPHVSALQSRGPTPGPSSVPLPVFDAARFDQHIVPYENAKGLQASAHDTSTGTMAWPFVPEMPQIQFANIRDLFKRSRVNSAPSRYIQAFSTLPELRRLGAIIDPFERLPRFKNGAIDVERFKSDCKFSHHFGRTLADSK